MKLTQIMCLTASMLVATAAKSQQPASQAPRDQSSRTKVVLLGTGTPVPDADHSGPATLIVVDERAYLVDFGPGVVRRAEAAALTREITAARPGNLKVAFVTHLHSDHTAGYSDLILTGWTSGRAPERVQSTVAKHHTTTAQLAELANKDHASGRFHRAAKGSLNGQLNGDDIAHDIDPVKFAVSRRLDIFGAIIQVQDVLRACFEQFKTISIDRQLRLYGPVVAGINQVFECREARKGLGHMATEFERHV